MKYIVRWQVYGFTPGMSAPPVASYLVQEAEFDTRAAAEAMIDVLEQSAHRLGVRFDLAPAVTARLEVDVDLTKNP